MKKQLPPFLETVSLALTLLAALPVLAAPPAESVFPHETVVWASLPDAPSFQQKFKATQLGQLAEDELLAPFAEHLRVQMMQRLGNVEATLGVTLDDVLAAAGGEFAMGMAHRDGQRAATLLTIDTRGKEAEAKQLLSKIEAAMQQRHAKRSSETAGAVALTVYRLPENPKAKITAEDLVQFELDGLLCFVESKAQAKQLIARASGRGTPPLKALEEFQQTMKRCQQAGGGVPEVRWYASPFKYDLARRSREPKNKLPNKKDTITILREQGFNAIRGVGGHVHVAVDESKDFVHRTAIFAPPKPGKVGRPAAEKYDLGMRMAETPNRKDLQLESWAPRSTANYSTFSLNVQNAFDNLHSVFDAILGHKGAMRNTLDGLERDPFGPKIKIRKQVIANLGNRVTRMADYRLPVTTDCERYLFVIEATNPAALKGPIDKWMESDGAELRKVRGVEYWEILPEDEVPVNVQLGGGLIPLDGQPADEEEDDPLLRSAAVCVHKGHLIIASDVEFLEQAVFGTPGQESLAGSYDFQAAEMELNKLADLNRCSWSFTRSDESIRPTYELLRQGKLPEGQTFFARLLNELLTTPEEEQRKIARKQRLDGAKLPTFELARRYFGPSARAVTAEDNGWFITGVVLNKNGK